MDVQDDVQDSASLIRAWAFRQADCKLSRTAPRVLLPPTVVRSERTAQER